MSTRRARIKAIASLPVRRKNVESSQAAVETSQTSDKIEKSQSENVAIETNIEINSELQNGAQAPLSSEVTNQPQSPTIEDEPPVNNMIEPEKSTESTNDVTKPILPKPNTTLTERRARIKAVACLPIRRKPAEINTTIKPQINSPKSTPKPLNQTPKPNTESVVRSTPNLLELQSVKDKCDIQEKTDNLQSPIKTMLQRKEERAGLSSNNTTLNQNLNSLSSLGTVSPLRSPINEVINSKLPPIKKSRIDGIVPLQLAPKINLGNNADLVKNEIISDVADVSFDPIVPLPSPSKSRPKLRPTPRLPTRRNSVQGSASESEEEGKRNIHPLVGTPLVAESSSNAEMQQPMPTSVVRLRHDSATSSIATPVIRETSRIRNDSVCSQPSQGGQSAINMSPLKEKSLLSRSRRSETSRRIATLRRKLRAKTAMQKEALTMYDLIFYNPTSNPIVEEKGSEVVKTCEKKEKLDVKQDKEGSAPPPPSTEEQEQNEDEPSAAPVPQIKLGPNGEIILDEKSLVINTSEQSARRLSTSVVHEQETAGALGSGGRYTRAPRTKDWSDAETVRFYRALAAIGTDFSLMLSLFPDRTRRDLKIKFKKEEKINSALVDKAMLNPVEFDVTQLKNDFEEERKRLEQEAEERRRADERMKEKERLEKIKIKNIRNTVRLGAAGKAMASILPDHPLDNRSTLGTANDLLEQDNMLKQTRKRKQIVPKTKTKKPSLPVVQSTASNSNSAGSKSPFFSPTAIIPNNVETGSLVVLTVPNPGNPSQKMLQTYLSGPDGKLKPIGLPPSWLSSVVQYMSKGSNNTNVDPLSRPSSVDLANLNQSSNDASAVDRSSCNSTPKSVQFGVINNVQQSVIKTAPGRSKSPTESSSRIRHNSYTMTSL